MSKYNLEGKVIKGSTELGDGASSRVFQGTWDGTLVAIKQLKMYVPRLAPSFVKAYEPLFNLTPKHCTSSWYLPSDRFNCSRILQ